MKNHILPLLLFSSFLSCGKKNKEHKIPYEQTPISLNSIASPELTALVNKFKQGYAEKHLRDFAELLLNEEKGSYEEKHERSVFEENAKIIFEKEETSTFQKTFLKSLSNQNVKLFKESLENFILKSQLPIDAPLHTDSNSSNIFDLLYNKSSNATSFPLALSNLYALMNSRESIRNQRLVVLSTEEGLFLGKVLQDPEQGQLLFALSNNGLGSKEKFFGPTHSLSGRIAIFDFEAFIILVSINHYNDLAQSAKDYLLDHSSRKFGFKVSSLNIEYESPSSLKMKKNEVSHLNAPKTPLNVAAESIESKYTQLDAQELEASLITFKERIKREEEEKFKQEEIQRLGSQYTLIGPWAHKFGGRENMKSSLLRAFGNNKLLSNPKVLTFKRSRECTEEDENGLSLQDSNFLREWGILGFNKAWSYENISADDLSLCRSQSNFGSLIKQHTRILQPLFVYLPQNPENLSPNDFAEKASSIENEQKRLVNLSSRGDFKT